ncbi:MAG: hypothetical protein HYZ42_07795, partial [Bacteroidetes bacterium]|nr:hypothetical protein [Bacteroidota bacterium]
MHYFYHDNPITSIKLYLLNDYIHSNLQSIKPTIMNKYLPNFKTTFLIVGITFIMLSLGLFAKGLLVSMAEFKVPQDVLNSPHYIDAITWVYIHMLVIGILILCIGLSAKETSHQKWISLLLFIISSIYTYLDFRT